MHWDLLTVPSLLCLLCCTDPAMLMQCTLVVQHSCCCCFCPVRKAFVVVIVKLVLPTDVIVVTVAVFHQYQIKLLFLFLRLMLSLSFYLNLYFVLFCLFVALIACVPELHCFGIKLVGCPINVLSLFVCVASHVLLHSVLCSVHINTFCFFSFLFFAFCFQKLKKPGSEKKKA